VGSQIGQEVQDAIWNDFQYNVAVRFVAGISSNEWPILQELMNALANELDVTLNQPVEQHFLKEHVSSHKYHGTTGRVLLLEMECTSTNYSEDDEEFQETFLAMLREWVDEVIYSGSGNIVNPILMSFLPNYSDADLEAVAQNLIEECIETYELAKPLSFQTQNDNASDRFSFIPSEVLEVDGAFIQEDSTEEKSWDTSAVAIFDHLVSDNLRQRLLALIGGNEDKMEPDPKQWARGGLMDLPMGDEEGASQTTATGTGIVCLGMTPQAISDLCKEQAHDAIEEVQDIWRRLFPDYHVTRLSEAVLGDSVSPLTANAPMFGDSFQVHIDGDPYFAPPSPWTDVYGRYPNRCTGKPRFVSFLIYLNPEWKDEWGASTLFLDVATDTKSHVAPYPGRCVLMDQDISHSVTAPSLENLGPRYSLVFKLILHPKMRHQSMRALNCGRSWPFSTQLGSAADSHVTNEL